VDIRAIAIQLVEKGCNESPACHLGQVLGAVTGACAEPAT